MIERLELLRESEARLRSILEATFDGVVFTRNGILVDVSEGIERFFGLPREKLIGSSVLDVVAPPRATTYPGASRTRPSASTRRWLCSPAESSCR